MAENRPYRKKRETPKPKPSPETRIRRSPIADAARIRLQMRTCLCHDKLHKTSYLATECETKSGMWN